MENNREYLNFKMKLYKKCLLKEAYKISKKNSAPYFKAYEN